MKVIVRGKHPKVTAKELRYAAKYMSSMLMTDKLCEQIAVRIRPMKLDEEGATLWLDTNHKPREFEVQLNTKLSREHTLYALGHELVHVRQFAKGELKQMARELKIKWKKKKYNALDQEDHLKYWSLPWEMEARAYEEVLMQHYKIHIKEQKKVDEKRKKRINK